VTQQLTTCASGLGPLRPCRSKVSPLGKGPGFCPSAPATGGAPHRARSSLGVTGGQRLGTQLALGKWRPQVIRPPALSRAWASGGCDSGSVAEVTRPAAVGHGCWPAAGRACGTTGVTPGTGEAGFVCSSSLEAAPAPSPRRSAGQALHPEGTPCPFWAYRRCPMCAWTFPPPEVAWEVGRTVKGRAAYPTVLCPCRSAAPWPQVCERTLIGGRSGHRAAWTQARLWAASGHSGATGVAAGGRGRRRWGQGVTQQAWGHGGGPVLSPWPLSPRASGQAGPRLEPRLHTTGPVSCPSFSLRGQQRPHTGQTVPEPQAAPGSRAGDSGTRGRLSVPWRTVGTTQSWTLDTGLWASLRPLGPGPSRPANACRAGSLQPAPPPSQRACPAVWTLGHLRRG
jgi:hypothetical protein